MRLLTTLFFIGLATFSKADTLDFVHVYHNGEAVLKTNIYSSEVLLEINASPGDTIMFKAVTDWDGLMNATLDIQDAAGAYDRTLNRFPNNHYGAEFILVVDEQLLNQTVLCSLNYDALNDQQPWQFAILTVKKD